MPGPAPKPAAQRRRRNKATTAALIKAPARPSVPALPATFTSQTQAWWQDIWLSPMAAEWERSDVHGLLILAQLWDDFWTAGSPTARAEAAREIRLRSAEFGLSPLSRRRLQWEIERGDAAAAKTAARAAPKRRGDPRLKKV